MNFEGGSIAFFRMAAATVGVATLLFRSSVAPAQIVPVVTGDAHVDKLLSQMTLAEKLKLIHDAPENPKEYQGQAGYVSGIPRLGIPGLRLADGPPGVLTRHPSQAETATMGVAATFDVKIAEANGIVIGREARALGIDVALQPFVNLDRDLAFKRAYNTFGEDPLLTSQMGAAEIRGIQSQHVMAMVKHFIGFDTPDSDVWIDDQTLHEIYLPPFEAAVKAGVAAVMCSYNHVNGPYACGNKSTLNGILRDELGFKGFVTSDWGATHSADFLNAGLDVEMIDGPDSSGYQEPAFLGAEPASYPPTVAPDGQAMGDLYGGQLPEESSPAPPDGEDSGAKVPPKTISEALKDGLVSEAAVTRAAGHVLFEMHRFGYLDGQSKHAVTAQAIQANAAIIERSGEEAAVLLKNDGGVLPLKAADLDSVVLIGPTAGQVDAIGISGERSEGLPERQIGPLEALKRISGNRRIQFAVADDMNGIPIPAKALSHDGKPGLLRAESDATHIDALLNFTANTKNALRPNSKAIWSGSLAVPSAGEYWLYLQALGTDASLTIDGKLIAATGAFQGDVHGDILQANQDNIFPTSDGLDNLRRAVQLTAGPHSIKIAISPDTSNRPVQIRLNWYTPNQRLADHDAAIAAAKRARVAVVFAWSRRAPFFELSGAQNQLIDEVTAVNPNTIVVLNTSQPVALPWVNRVKAILEMWWPGDEGGWATANVLLGKRNPGGRLPMTWARRLEDYSATDPRFPERSGKGVDDKTVFSEGVNIGYRWFDHEKIEPLFPFGYGLSYTTFQYSDLHVDRAVDGGLTVRFRIENIGNKDGDEVPQVYLGAPRAIVAGAAIPMRSLAAFDRVSLKAGESKTVSLHVDERRLQYWSTSDKRWENASLNRTLSVGTSSRDLRLEQVIDMILSADAGQLRNQMPALQAGDVVASASLSGIYPVQLKTEDAVNPLGIDAPSPRLSWLLQSRFRLDRGLAQSAYRILVASSPQILARNQGDVWDSGKILSSKTFNVSYHGPPLISLNTYYWKLAVWDGTCHQSNWSKPARWTIGILRSEEWTARWIAATPDFPPSPQPRENMWDFHDRSSPLAIFRHAFSLDKPVRRALVLISGLGQYELHVNGRPVTESVLNPGWTDYRKTILYNSWDVTSLLKPGANVLAVMLGNGMYNVEGVKGRYTKFIGSFGQPKLLLQMQIDFTDGSSTKIVSDRSWKTVPGPIVFSSIYGGEDYDARREQQGWDTPAFQDSTWAQALEVDSPGGQMVAQMLPPIRVTKVFSPRLIKVQGSATRIYDLGQNIAGWPEIVVRGSRGSRIEITAGELLDNDGRVTQNSANARPGSANLFSYTLKGTGDETWHPRFSYYGFRYIQITAVKSQTSSNLPVLLALKGDFVHADAAQVGEFSTSNLLFMRIHRLIDMAILSNMVSILTDCPQREKLGWLEQTYLAGSAIFLNYDVAPLYRKVARDIRDAQLPNGMTPSIAPEYVAFVDKQGNNTDFRDSPEWGSAAVLSPFTAYEYTGDRSLLADSYEAMVHYVAYLRSRMQDNMLSYGLGDWYDIGPNPPGESQLTSKSLTATATYYQDLTTLAQIAQLLDKPGDAQSFQKEADAVRSTMTAHLLHPDTGLYDRGSQTANAMALALGLVPDDLRAAVMHGLVENIREHDNHVTTGDIGFHYEVRALTDGGHSGVLNDMLSRTDSPSYGNQLAKGATTLTEAWDTNPDSSQNHFMLGHAEEWFYRGLAGIDFDLNRPASSRIVIRPSLIPGTREAFASYNSVLGKIVSHWSRNATHVTFDITIPPGASATIYLPTSKSDSVRESGRPLHSATGIQNFAVEEDRVKCIAGSGEYHFLLPVNGLIPEN